MPIALILIGVILLIAAVRNTQGTLFTLVKGDFTGKNNFIFWLVAILVIGAIGNVKQLKGFSNAFLALVIIVILLSNKGFFAQFQTALSTTTSTSTTTSNTAGNVLGAVGGLASLAPLI